MPRRIRLESDRVDCETELLVIVLVSIQMKKRDVIYKYIKGLILI